jgi:predicted alpha/beta superfamily hydrolase
MFRRMSLITLLLLVVIIAGCQSAEPETVEVPVTVEVTRVVEVAAEPPEPEMIEVTREVEVPVEVPVEVEVTRVVEVAAEQPVPEAPVINPMMPIAFDTIASSATGRDYTLTVALPISYMFTEADYPVVFVTDGDFYAIPLAMAAGQLAFGQEIPEFITVGVDYGNPNPMEWLELREMDMGVEGSEKFVQFFEEELIPYIEANYRADSTNRTLVGHSSGGNFALYGLLHAADTFSNFISSSPGGAAWWMDAIENFSANQGETPAKLYLSVGDLDDPASIADIQAFSDALAGMGFEGLDQEMAILENETHLSVRPRAFTNAMRWLFGGGNE